MIERWEKDLLAAIYAKNLAYIRHAVSQNPQLANHRINGETLLHEAALASSLEIAQVLIEHGSDVNAPSYSGEELTDQTVLIRAIYQGNRALVELLLQSGADPCRSRPAISAITGAPEQALEFIKLLEKYGADLHRVFPFGEDYRPVNALSMAKAYSLDDVVEYLLARGARMPEQYSAEEIAAYFDRSGACDASTDE